MTNLTEQFIKMMAGNNNIAESKYNENTSSSQPSTFKNVTVTRLMVEITKYPNGNEYCKAWIVNTGEKKNAPKKAKPKNEAKTVKNEVEEL
jgi:hypothetical protein